MFYFFRKVSAWSVKGLQHSPAKHLYRNTTLFNKNGKTFNKDTAKGMWLHHIPVRSLVTAYEYSGMTQVANTHVSAVNGLLATQFMLNLYQFAKLNQVQYGSIPSYLQLVLELFHYQDTLRNTQLKTNPAYSLDPVLLAKIIAFLSGNIDSKVALQPIIEEWKSKHKSQTGKSYPSKIQRFLDICIQAKKESLSPALNYLPEIILLNFLHYKAKDRQDLMNYTLELNKHISFPDKDLLSAKNRFDMEDITEGKGILEELLSEPQNCDPKVFEFILSVKMEEIIAYQFCKKLEQPLEVLQGNYTYHQSQYISAPSCFETAFHNLFNKLLFDKTTQGFNFSLLPSGLNIEKRFKHFYEHQTIYNLNSPGVGADFMNMLADNETFYYVSPQRRFELETDPRNFLKVMGYVLGSPMDSLKQLSDALSTEQRKIQFSEEQNKDSIYIKITIEEVLHSKKLAHKEEMRFLISPSHAYLHANYHKRDDNVLTDKSALKTIGPKIKNPMMLSLLFANASEYLPLKNSVDSIENLRQQFIIFPPGNSERALNFCQEALSFSDHYPEEVRKYLLYCYHVFFEESSDSSNFIMAMLTCVESEEHFQFLMDLLSGVTETVISEKTISEWLSQKNEIGNTVLYSVKNAKVAQLLIEKGADVKIKNTLGRTPLHVVSDPDIAKILIEKGVNVNEQDVYGDTALHVHVEKNKIIAEMLIKNGAWINALNSIHATPLHLAKDWEIVNLLINAGACVNMATKLGSTPLYYASTGEIARLLIAAGADVNHTKNNEGKSSLHLAVEMHNEEVVNVLLEARSDVNTQDNEECTPLHYALTQEMTSTLLRAGADPTIRDKFGRTHADYFPAFYCVPNNLEHDGKAHNRHIFW